MTGSIRYNPQMYEKVNRFLEHIRVRIVYDDNNEQSGAALRQFSYKYSRGEYRIYIDPSLSGADYEAADLFEKGHILFGHFEADERELYAERVTFERALLAKRSTLLAFLPDDAGKRLSFYTTYVWKRFWETAQAVEIKTKLFDDAASAQKFALPPDLNWKSYLRLLAENPAVSLPVIIGNPKTGAQSALASGDEGDAQDIAAQDGEAQYIAMQKWGRTLHRAKAEAPGAVTGTSLPQLPEILRERSLALKKTKMTTDLFYYENRNKYATGLLMPRRRRVEKLAAGNVVILLDVSGSIPAAFTEAAVNAIIGAEDAFDAENSRLVCWSTELVEDTALFGIQKVAGGGGTALAGGIEYCQKYIGGDSAFFIISDLQDEIAEWIESAKAMHTRKTVIAYNKFGASMSAEQWFARVGSNADYRKEEVLLSEWSRHFDTLLVAP